MSWVGKVLLSSLVVAALLLVTACASTAESPAATAQQSPSAPADQPTSWPTPTVTPLEPTPTPPPPTPTKTPSPTATDGFAFSAEDVLAYYVSQGYACTGWQPSTVAAGFSVRSCSLIDDKGRTRVIGVAVDAEGGLADGLASVQAAEGEASLAPIDALEPLAGFLGAMLGEERGSTILTWLATHLGDAYTETSVGSLRVATYFHAQDDPVRLYVEVANQAYLDAGGFDGGR